MRPRHLALPSALIIVASMAAPANAVVSVSGSDITGNSDSDFITVTCTGGNLTAVGAPAPGDPCSAVTELDVQPGGGVDSVDLSGVTGAAFPALRVATVGTVDAFADTVHGSPLSDDLDGDNDDTLNGNAGNDTIRGGDSVSGGLGDDTIVGFFGSGVASGGPGDDRFLQFVPLSGIEGGTGFDSWELDFDQAGNNPGGTFSLMMTADQFRYAVGPTSGAVTVSGIEQLYLTLMRGDTQLFDASAFPGSVHVRGMAGTDTLTGGTLDDVLQGGNGNDTVTGGLGSDLLNGGDGDDTINARDGVADRVDCGAGTDSVVADAVDVIVNCESTDLPPVVTPPVVSAPVVTPPVLTPPVAVVPETGAIAGPARVTKPKKTSFKFTSPTAGATFQCKIDGKAWKTCASPYKVATKKLKPGKHKLLVRAVVGGAVDATPSKKVFKVRRG